MAQNIPFQVPPLPNWLAGGPMTTWGIAYDIFTPRTENDLENGWHSYRTNTYSQLIRILRGAGFIHSQYSAYIRHKTDAVATWRVMMSLMDIDPAGKMETTVKGLKMYTMEHVNLQDVSHQVRLGGVYARVLRGPSPRGLVHPVIQRLLNVPQELVNILRLPKYTRPSDAARIGHNWMA